ncbi:MAG: flagellin FliC3 [Lachnospiraceae bacterium]|nr:flagellin FliC3 [Lachnospiraceae bacterium]
MRINYNVSAMISNNALSNNDNLLAKSLQRLSSGLKINQAKDNPAGLAMSKRMNAQLEGLNVASQNASDGVSVIEIADGAMTEISEMLQRMNELAVKAANGTMTTEDRETIQAEIAQLKEEITRVSETAEFNGQKLLNGEFEMKGYTDNVDIKVNSYSSDVPVKEYTITSLSLGTDADGNYTLDGITYGDGFPDADSLEAEIADDLLTIKGDNGFEMTLDVSGATATSYNNLTVDVSGIGAMRLQIGANEGQILAIDIPAITLQNLGIEEIDVTTVEGAKDTLVRVDSAIQTLSKIRGQLGAYQNRLESSINSLDITSENMTAAYSRIMDVDMAEEMTRYTTYQVLTQAGTSMLAQANERPSQVLQLLQ